MEFWPKTSTAALAIGLLASLNGCEEQTQSPPNKPTPNYGYQNQAQAPTVVCSQFSSNESSCRAKYQCLWLSGAKQCIESASDSCSARQSSATDCTTTSQGAKCSWNNGSCTQFTSCEQISVADCEKYPECRKASSYNVETCTTQANASNIAQQNAQQQLLQQQQLQQLHERQRQEQQAANGRLMGVLLPGIFGLAGALLFRNDPNGQMGMQNVLANMQNSMLNSYAQAPLMNSYAQGRYIQDPNINQGVYQDTYSQCTNLGSSPSMCDQRYPTCAWVSGRCLSTNQLSRYQICNGVTEYGGVMSYDARQRCQRYGCYSDGTTCREQ